MSASRMKVLIAGGYGVFGGRLAQLLADEPRLVLVIAGRSKAKAEAFCAALAAKATLVPARFDRDGDVLAQIGALKPDLIADASGPFQAYGDDPYKLVKAALALGINYLDLADGSGFVRGISQFDASAKKSGVFVLSGVSSFPVLTAAVVRQLAVGLIKVDTITGGIAPSPYAGVGLNVIRAISSYAGKPLPLTRDGRTANGYGLTGTLRATIAPPGRLPLKSTLFSLVDVPDLTMLPEVWPGLRSIWMGAGPVPEVLHRGLIALAWLVRLRVLPSLTVLAPLFHAAINTLRWGEHRGGMFVRIEGRMADGEQIARSWHLLAEGSDGPMIPSMAIEAIVRRCLIGHAPPAGARPALADLELADYDALFARRTIFTGLREVPKGGPQKPLFQRILGSAWDELPQPVRDMHYVNGELTAVGTAEVTRGGNPVARIVAGAFGFPPAGQNVPLTVHMTSDGNREIWTRQFAGRQFRSVLTAGRGRSEWLLTETFGSVTFAIALVWSANRLSFVVRRWSILGMPLPLALAPGGDTFESAQDGRFHFNVEIKLPLFGLIVRYRGCLNPIPASDYP